MERVGFQLIVSLVHYKYAELLCNKSLPLGHLQVQRYLWHLYYAVIAWNCPGYHYIWLQLETNILIDISIADWCDSTQIINK